MQTLQLGCLKLKTNLTGQICRAQPIGGSIGYGHHLTVCHPELIACPESDRRKGPLSLFPMPAVQIAVQIALNAQSVLARLQA